MVETWFERLPKGTVRFIHGVRNDTRLREGSERIDVDRNTGTKRSLFVLVRTEFRSVNDEEHEPR